MTDIDNIKSLIKRGEGIDIEFKESRKALNKDVYQTICAFLNRIGGHILLGVRDDGEIIGVEESAVSQIKKDFINTINNPTKIAPVFYTNIEEYTIDDKIVLHIPIPASSQVHRLKGRIYDRNGDADIDITDSTITVAELYFRKNNVVTEIRVFPHIEISDIDPKMFILVKRLASSQKSKPHLWKTLDDIELLKSANLYGKDPHTKQEGINLAGILLLGSEQLILSVLPHHKTDAILRVKNLDRYDDRDVICTNLIESFDRLMAFIEKHLNDPFYLEGTQRISIRNKIFREVCSNLLIHREFSNAFPAKLIINQDNVKTENANRPRNHGSINPADFSPFPKNPIISKFFREIGLADELGSGFKNIEKYMPIYSGQDAKVVDEDIFKLIIPLNEPTKKSTSQDTPQDRDQVADQDRDQVANQDSRIEKLLDFCITPRSRVEMQNFIGISGKTYFKKSLLKPLLDSGQIKMTIPDKPSSKNQKYVKSEFLVGE
jgi:ATP-dependent DNA helicase RecG